MWRQESGQISSRGGWRGSGGRKRKKPKINNDDYKWNHSLTLRRSWGKYGRRPDSRGIRAIGNRGRYPLLTVSRRVTFSIGSWVRGTWAKLWKSRTSLGNSNRYIWNLKTVTVWITNLTRCAKVSSFRSLSQETIRRKAIQKLNLIETKYTVTINGTSNRTKDL